MQARQQMRRRELQRAKRRTLLIRYDLITAPILLIGLVVFFVVTRQPLALISGAVVLVAAVALLAFATLMPTRNTSRPTSSEAPKPQDGPASDGAQPSADQSDDQATSDDQE